LLSASGVWTAPRLKMSRAIGTVIAKTYAISRGVKGICLAVLADDGRLVRPVAIEGAARPFWEDSEGTRALQVGSRIVLWTSSGQSEVGYPHKNEDVQCRHVAALQGQVNICDELFGLLGQPPIAVKSLSSAWPARIRVKQGGTVYVRSGENVPSMIVLHGRIRSYEPMRRQATLQVGSDLLNIKVTAPSVSQRLSQMSQAISCCVVLGLARATLEHAMSHSDVLPACEVLLISIAETPYRAPPCTPPAAHPAYGLSGDAAGLRMSLGNMFDRNQREGCMSTAGRFSNDAFARHGEMLGWKSKQRSTLFTGTVVHSAIRKRRTRGRRSPM